MDKLKHIKELFFGKYIGYVKFKYAEDTHVYFLFESIWHRTYIYNQGCGDYMSKRDMYDINHWLFCGEISDKMAEAFHPAPQKENK